MRGTITITESSFSEAIFTRYTKAIPWLNGGEQESAFVEREPRGKFVSRLPPKKTFREWLILGDEE